MSKTPRTDEATQDRGSTIHFVRTDFARQLELELATANELLNKAGIALRETKAQLEAANQDAERLTDERAMELSNHVSEEYVDRGDVSFATKKELCELVLWLRDKNQKDFEFYRGALHEIFSIAASRLLTRIIHKDAPPQEPRTNLPEVDQ